MYSWDDCLKSFSSCLCGAESQHPESRSGKVKDCLLSHKTSLFNKALNEQNTDHISFSSRKKKCDIMVQTEQIEQINIIYSFKV